MAFAQTNSPNEAFAQAALSDSGRFDRLKHSPNRWGFLVVGTFVIGGAAYGAGCSSSSTPLGGEPSTDGGGGGGGGGDTTAFNDGSASTLPVSPLLAGCTKDPGGGIAPKFDPNASSDPLAGSFSLSQALEGFPEGNGTLTAAITTELGGIKCTLDDKNAPLSVANFIGLARGTRPYQNPSTKTWQSGHFYDGLLWHRVIPDFVIQGGDPLGNGMGGPGFDLATENQIDEPMGTLAVAAAAEPSGSQFYIVVGTGPAAQYNVFGTCDTVAAIMIAGAARDTNDKPTTPVHMQRIDIARCP